MEDLGVPAQGSPIQGSNQASPHARGGSPAPPGVLPPSRLTGGAVRRLMLSPRESRFTLRRRCALRVPAVAVAAVAAVAEEAEEEEEAPGTDARAGAAGARGRGARGGLRLPFQ